MQTIIRVGAVSYLNSKPLIYGFENGMMKDHVALLIDYPSRIASMLLTNEIDIGLVPVAIIPEMNNVHIVSDYCIGSFGEVASVCLFSEVPLEKIETVLLDYQSRTSIQLLKVLIKEYWKINVVFKNTSGDYQQDICGTTAGLIIGDRALKQRKVSRYIFDLGLEWKNFTGLPFVFAAWISNKKLNNDFINEFNQANAFGLKRLSEVIELYNKEASFDLNEYYLRYIQYHMDSDKLNGLKLFLEKLQE